MTGRFKGTPMATHFARWLHLFVQTATVAWPPEAANLVIASRG